MFGVNSNFASSKRVAAEKAAGIVGVTVERGGIDTSVDEPVLLAASICALRLSVNVEFRVFAYVFSVLENEVLGAAVP